MHLSHGQKEVGYNPIILVAYISDILTAVKPESTKTLPLALLKCGVKPFIAAIMPRLALILFRYSQPPLIKRSIRFVTSDALGEDNDYGYWLVVTAIIVYVGVAVSSYYSTPQLLTVLSRVQVSKAVYQNRLNRLQLITRSALVGLIHDKTMKSPSLSYDNGESTTLMSSDADSLDGSAKMFHETWGNFLELVIGLILLAREVGWITPLPLFLIFCRLCNFCTWRFTINMYRLFSCEPICCEEPTASPKGMEQCNTRPCSRYELYAKPYENHQDVGVPEVPCGSHLGASGHRTICGFQAQMDHSILQHVW